MGFLFDSLLSVAVSIDCLTVSITMSNVSVKRKRLFVVLVSGCHFLFPYIGNVLMVTHFDLLTNVIDVVSGSIFFSLGLFNLFNSFSDQSKEVINQSVILIALLVSLDSLFIGLAVYDNTFGLSLLFSLMSLLFCLMGFFIGGEIEKVIGPFFHVVRGLIFIGFGTVILFS
ncbi:hypothetical protein GCM10012290_21330 [Halolactibacillus alkaliphilus]|uniref:Manganese efflux pump MntP n=1 Tax=Halolactibacillus alkaliphilus TaxID=442899 RepID=A0A511X443_9BACI|nr:manganese efflux pump [Halolactibacillus alkaliphilus]GEN57718.1 hypothetical protein HAL01_21820 [Halolactibacillus alkaliphilus]GGN73952.1 hypothetical protein GCM10012290_21330 [Halolactibacillus alkaliphilus]SFO99336.1 Putative Mn2+ efflux pump MntP [Halolactibacillus alkaliphilus]